MAKMEAAKAAARKLAGAQERARIAGVIDRGGKLQRFEGACTAKGLNPRQTFERLYGVLSHSRGLQKILTEAELDARVTQQPFDEAQFWAEIMVVNGLSAPADPKQIRVPKRYLPQKPGKPIAPGEIDEIIKNPKENSDQ
jgi:hypothetical protein